MEGHGGPMTAFIERRFRRLDQNPRARSWTGCHAMVNGRCRVRTGRGRPFKDLVPTLGRTGIDRRGVVVGDQGLVWSPLGRRAVGLEEVLLGVLRVPRVARHD